ncbi:hypothetical protein Tco_1358301, partial [Tanacetum coccineum]
VESHKTLLTTVDVLKLESKAKEDKYLEEIIELEKKKKALDNMVYKMGIPYELPTISLVKDSFNKMRNYVNDFENVVTFRTKVTGQNEGSWGFEQIQKAFHKDVKPFVKTLKEYFHMSDQGLHIEITGMKEVFTQIKIEAAKCCVERKTFAIKEKELLLANDRLLELFISQNIVHNAVNSFAEILDYQSMEKSFLDEYSECVELKAELSKKNDMVEKDVYDELSKRCARIENRCISLEIKVQQYKERVISSTSASGSKPPGNTKKNRISSPTSRNKKNKVEDHLRTVKPSLNKKNRVSEPTSCHHCFMTNQLLLWSHTHATATMVSCPTTVVVASDSLRSDNHG